MSLWHHPFCAKQPAAVCTSTPLILKKTEALQRGMLRASTRAPQLLRPERDHLPPPPPCVSRFFLAVPTTVALTLAAKRSEQSVSGRLASAGLTLTIISALLAPPRLCWRRKVSLELR
jgi:hypothetical protein